MSGSKALSGMAAIELLSDKAVQAALKAAKDRKLLDVETIQGASR